MRIVYNDIVPFKGYKAMLIGPWLFVRNGYKLDETDLTHERIHYEQQKEILFVFFYLWYVVEWLIRLLLTFDCHKAYRGISFEREAYDNEKSMIYPYYRGHYRWFDYLTKK